MARSSAFPLAPDRPVGQVTNELLAAVRRMAGDVQIDPTPQEVPWSVPLDADYEHATYDPKQVAAYFEAAGRAAMILAEYRAPYRGRSTPVNAWWGSFDLSVSLFSGQPADPPSERLHHAQFDGRAGGGRRMVAGGSPPPGCGVLRLRSSRAAGYMPAKLYRQRLLTGMPGSASTYSTGTTSGLVRTRTRPGWHSCGPRSRALVTCADGTRPWPPARTASRRQCTSCTVGTRRAPGQSARFAESRPRARPQAGMLAG